MAEISVFVYGGRHDDKFALVSNSSVIITKTLLCLKQRHFQI